MLKSIEEVYCIIDEIVQYGIQSVSKKGRKGKLSMSEVITILVEGHKRGYSTEKQLHRLMITELKKCFRSFPSYAQFTRSIRKALPYIDLILSVFTKINTKKKQDFCIVDSTALPVTGYNRYDVK